MGAKSSRNTSQNNRSDGHLLSYLRNTFVRGGGGAPLVVTYSVSPSVSSLNEGSSVTFTILTTNVPNGTTLYWTLNTVSGTINASDFSGGATSGSFTITNSSGSVVLTLANDTTTEGTESFQLQVRTDSTIGTIVATSSTVTINDTSVGYLTATAPGATTIDSGGFRIHVWTGPGSFVVSAAPPAGNTVEYLVVAGGAGGSWGGGGAGGLRTGTNFPITATTYPITVGGGGPAVPSPANSAGVSPNGNPSIFSTITSTAGGGAGTLNGTKPGSSGGSGGGGGGDAGTGGAGNTPPVSPSQGNPGGTGGPGTSAVGGGGGGGGGYFGGGGGGGDTGGFGGGGGSGYFNPSYCPTGTLYSGSTTTAGNSSDPQRGTSGNSGTGGRIVINAV